MTTERATDEGPHEGGTAVGRLDWAVPGAIVVAVGTVVIDNLEVVLVLLALVLVLVVWYRGWLPILLPLSVVLLHWSVGSTRTALRDALVLLGMYIAGRVVLRWHLNRLSLDGPRSAPDLAILRRFSLVVAAGVWFGLHVADRLFQPSIADRLGSRDWAGQANPWPQARIGLALSGGGYRAALYHAGVITALERRGIEPAVVSSVSGGSIVAAYYARGGDLPAFVKLVASGGFNVKRSILAPWNITRMILSIRSPRTGDTYLPISHFSRLDVQAGILSRTLFGDQQLSSAMPLGAPLHVIAATDLISGDLVGLMPKGLVRAKREKAANRGGFVNRVSALDTLLAKGETWERARITSVPSLSEAVAASGAFPGAFEPLRLTANYWSYDVQALALGDGGLADNMGTAILFHLHVLGGGAKTLIPGVKSYVLDSALGVAQHILIASDASAISRSSRVTSPFSEVGSAIDAIYTASGGNAASAAADAMSVPAFLLSPETLLRKQLTRRDAERLRHAKDHEFVLSLTYTPRKPFNILAPRDTVPMHHWSPPYWTEPSFSALSVDDLRFIIGLLPELERVEAEKMLPDITALTELRLTNATRFLAGGDTAVHRRIEALEDIDLKLFGLLAARVARDLAVFIDASTLRDTYTADEAKALVRLGAFVATWNYPQLAVAIGEAVQFKPSRACRRGRVTERSCPSVFMSLFASPPPSRQ